MTTEITRKQAILLGVLGVLLVMICYVQFLIRPMLTTASETKEQIETLAQQYELLVQQGENYDTNVEALEGWREKNSTETSRLFPLSDSNRIDRFLTFVAHECGTTITALTISDTLEYYVDGENNLVLADPDLQNTAADAAASSTTDSTATDAAAGYTATGEYTCDFTYTMEGTYQDMTQMLNFVNRVSFLGITSYSFQSISDQDNAALQDQYQFTLTITAYMYQDPLKSTEDTEEDASAEESSTDAAAETTAIAE